ncbi:MAG: mechanosensitive ion channel [Alphaproteobacteria bacterium]|nr:mechanosensitive ion channel [Alphaproteobacteria bacterium]
MFKFIRFICTAICFSLFIISPTYAQNENINSFEKKEINISSISEDIQKIEKSISKTPPTKNQSIELVKKLNEFYTSAQIKRNTEQAKLDELQKQITALGTLEEGSKESKEIANKRTQFSKEIESVKTQISKIDLAIAQIDNLNKRVANIRAQSLFDTLTIKRNSILNIKEFANTLINFSGFIYQLLQYPFAWYQEQPIEIKKITINRLFSLLFWAFSALGFAIIINIFIRKKLGYDQPIEKPNYSQKVQAGFFMILARAIIPAAIPVAFLTWRNQNPDFLTGQFGILVDIFAHYLIYLFLFVGISSVLFTPKKTQWRLIEVNNERACKITKTLCYSIIFLCFFSFLHVAASKLGVGEETVYAIKMINNCIKGICIMFLAHGLLYNSASLTDEEMASTEEVQGLSFSSRLSILIILASAIVLSFSLIGYVKLAEYVYNRFFVSIAFIGVGYIFQKFIFVLFHQLMNKKFWGKNLRLTKQKVTRIEFLFNLFTVPIIGAFITLCILGVWGVSVDIMIQNLKKVLVGFDIGGMHVSLTSIFMGIAAFLITNTLFKTIKNSLAEGKLSQAFDLDIGVRTSIAALVGFFGTILAFIVALSVMGGSLKGLAIAAGALSLGAGLGLQNVVNNFVSGIILLFERPFKIGDWILIDQYEGIVKQINMRSTQIETFNKSNVIIPNATLLSNSLINMTYKNKQSRVDLHVGVDYTSDINEVTNTLLECAKETKGVLQVPAPYVAVMELVDNSLNFRLSFYISDVGNRLSMQTAVYSLIVEKFRERNINIPFPQRVIHVQKDEDVKNLNFVD